MIKIDKEYLKNISINDSFFDSLKEDYFGFNEWFMKKSIEEEKAYITKTPEGNLGSILLLKLEDESEDYSMFETPFEKMNRLKVCTFKVDNFGKQIGKKYIEIINNIAQENKVKEIYLTTFPKQELLIKLFLENGFILKTKKLTKKRDLSLEEELVLVKTVMEDKK